MKAFAQELVDRRLAAQKSQAQLAKELGITQTTVSRWELGLTMPRLKGLPALAKALGCPVGVLHAAMDCTLAEGNKRPSSKMPADFSTRFLMIPVVDDTPAGVAAQPASLFPAGALVVPGALKDMGIADQAGASILNPPELTLRECLGDFTPGAFAVRLSGYAMASGNPRAQSLPAGAIVVFEPIQAADAYQCAGCVVYAFTGGRHIVRELAADGTGLLLCAWNSDFKAVSVQPPEIKGRALFSVLPLAGIKKPA